MVFCFGSSEFSTYPVNVTLLLHFWQQPWKGPAFIQFLWCFARISFNHSPGYIPKLFPQSCIHTEVAVLPASWYWYLSADSGVFSALWHPLMQVSTIRILAVVAAWANTVTFWPELSTSPSSWILWQPVLDSSGGGSLKPHQELPCLPSIHIWFSQHLSSSFSYHAISVNTRVASAALMSSGYVVKDLMIWLPSHSQSNIMDHQDIGTRVFVMFGKNHKQNWSSPE